MKILSYCLVWKLASDHDDFSDLTTRHPGGQPEGHHAAHPGPGRPLQAPLCAPLRGCHPPPSRHRPRHPPLQCHRPGSGQCVSCNLPPSFFVYFSCLHHYLPFFLSLLSSICLFPSYLFYPSLITTVFSFIVIPPLLLPCHPPFLVPSLQTSS